MLRLFFILKFPVQDSGDAPFYIDLAWNWLKNGVYGVQIAGHLTPVDMRVPGYPAFLAADFRVFRAIDAGGDAGAGGVDLATCFLVALIAARLAPPSSRRRVALAGLWLAALCPFTANYTAVVLTESLVTFLTALAILVLLEACVTSPPFGDDSSATGATLRASATGSWRAPRRVWNSGAPGNASSAACCGLGAVAEVVASRRLAKLVRAVALLTAGLILPLVPWAARNWNELHDVQFLAPHYSTLPGEFAPLGFDAWINTWLWRFRDVYLVTWKLDVEEISVDDLPPSAFDSPQQKAPPRARFLKTYNDTLTLEP